MKRIVLFCYTLIILQAAAIAQEAAPSLSGFFQERLAASPDTPPPSYDALLRVTDTIAGSSSDDIAAALPFISAALKRDESDQAVQAAFALSVIAHRPDGGALLRTRVSEIGALLERPDERLSGGATLILRYLSPSTSDLTVPILMRHLDSRAKPSLVKAEIVSMLLDFRRDDPQAMKSIENFLGAQAEPQVRIATLKVLGAHHVSTPRINEFALRSLNDRDKHVKSAAIYTLHALGSDAWNGAQPALRRIVLDPAEDRDVRALADKALASTLIAAPRQ